MSTTENRGLNLYVIIFNMLLIVLAAVLITVVQYHISIPSPEVKKVISGVIVGLTYLLMHYVSRKFV